MLLDDVLGLPADRALDAELDLIATLDHRDPASDVVSPTDTCPDNAIRTADGWRFVDLEGATVHHAAYDAAYAAMPFSTCWCVFDPPPGFTDQLLDRFTATLGTHLPDLVREPGWTRSVDLASAAWILAMTGWLLFGADEDRPRVGPPGVPVAVLPAAAHHPMALGRGPAAVHAARRRRAPGRRRGLGRRRVGSVRRTRRAVPRVRRRRMKERFAARTWETGTS